MATWVGDDRDRLDALAADIAALFDDAEQRLRRALAVQVAAGLEQHPENVARAVDLAALRRDAQQIVGALRALLPDQVDRLLAVAREDGALAALQELSALADVPDVTSAARAPAGAGAASALTADLTNALDDVTARILRWPDDVYRRVVAQSTTDLLLGLGATQRTVQARSWQQLVRQGVSGFTDKRGRRWNLATYVEMATRTAAHRAWEQHHTAALVERGVDLVSIVVGRGACEVCSRWAGKVLRVDDGPTGRLRVRSAVDDGAVTVRVVGTLAQARAHGWQHPNCRCRPVAYLPGLSVIEDVTTYDPDAERSRAKLRELERETRKAKADAAAAVDAEQRAAANARVRDLQGRIREHVDEHGLMRQRRREQISLGNRRLTDGPTVTRRPVAPSQRA